MPRKDPVARARYIKERYQLQREERIAKQKLYHEAHKEERSKYMKSYKTRNAQKTRDDMKRFMDSRRAWLHKLKDVPCLDCGVKYPPVCMDFDHRTGETKLFNIATITRWNNSNIDTELAKCDIVCANCHRIRTYKRAKKME